MFDNMVVVFTMGDKLPPAYTNNFGEELKQANRELKQVLKDANGCYVILGGSPGNDDTYQTQDIDRQKGVTQLLDIVLSLHNDSVKINPLRAVLLGARGSEKNAPRNSILNANPEFSVHMGLSAPASEASSKASATFRGFKFEILDTPGISLQESPNPEQLSKDVHKWFSTSEVRPDVVLFVVKTNEHCKDEVVNAYKAFQRDIGDDFNKHVIVVFTGGHTSRKEDQTLQEEIAPSSFQNLLAEVANRYVAFHKETSSPTERLLQRNLLLKEMTTLKEANENEPLKLRPQETSSSMWGSLYNRCIII